MAERMPDRARYLADTYGVLVTSLPDAVENATFVIIAVKPSDVGVGDRRDRQGGRRSRT